MKIARASVGVKLVQLLTRYVSQLGQLALLTTFSPKTVIAIHVMAFVIYARQYVLIVLHLKAVLNAQNVRDTLKFQTVNVYVTLVNFINIQLTHVRSVLMDVQPAQT